MAFVASFSSLSIEKLIGSWKSLGTKVFESKTHLEDIMSSKHNFSTYREALRVYQNKSKSDIAIVPYIGVLMKDLTALSEIGYSFQEDNKESYSSSKLFVLQKLIKEFQDYQTNFYKFHINITLHEAFSSQLFCTLQQ